MHKIYADVAEQHDSNLWTMQKSRQYTYGEVMPQLCGHNMISILCGKLAMPYCV